MNSLIIVIEGCVPCGAAVWCVQRGSFMEQRDGL